MVTTGATVASSGSRILAIREGDWKLIRHSVEPQAFHGNAIGTRPQDQLYNLANDPSETTDLASTQADRARRLAARLDTIERDGRSRP